MRNRILAVCVYGKGVVIMTTLMLAALVYSTYALYVLAGCLLLFGIMCVLEMNWWRVIGIRKHARFGVAEHLTYYTVAHTCFGIFWVDAYDSTFKPFKFDKEAQAYKFLAELREEGRRNLTLKVECKLAKKKKTKLVEKYEMVTAVHPSRCEYLAKKVKENAAE